MYSKILNDQLRLNPILSISDGAKDIIKQLLRKDVICRLGSSEADFEEIKIHLFFDDINWQDLIDKKIQPPWVPKLDSLTDLRHIDPEFTKEKISESVGRSLMGSQLADQNSSSAFDGFTYIGKSKLDTN